MKIGDGKSLDLRAALNNGQCGSCGERLWWTCDMDANGPTWSTDCCGKFYLLVVQNARARVEDKA